MEEVKVETAICPKCDVTELRSPIETNALSRLTRNTEQRIWICSDCGMTEALEDYERGTVKPIIISDPRPHANVI